MPRLKHEQLDPLAIAPLELSRIRYHYRQISSNRMAFDDFTPFDFDEFYTYITSPRSLSYEIGDGVGLCTFIFLSPTNASIQLAFYDYNYRDYICQELCRRAFEAGATRITTTATEDRESAQALIGRIGAKYEGTLRQAFYRDSKYYDVHIYGLLKEDAIWLQSQQV